GHFLHRRQQCANNLPEFSNAQTRLCKLDGDSLEGHSTIGPSSQLLGVVDLAPRWMSMASEGLGAASKRLQLSSENDVEARGRLSHSYSGPHPVVFIIDDDASIREALRNLFQSVGLRVEVYGCAAEVLRSKLPAVASCLVLDVRLPGMSGIDV